MSFADPPAEPADAAPLQVPASLRRQLRDYRRRVWTIKTLEAAGMALLAAMAAFLVVFILDRRWDTPASLRMAILLLVLAAGLAVPVYLYRWVWRHRHPHQVARLLSRKLPQTGDALLGVIELVHNRSEQARSPALCRAAIDQVAQESQARDFRHALPDARHRTWVACSAVAVLVVGAAAVAVPAASANAWSRFLLPWKPTPRYTFTQVDRLPRPWVLPHGESVPLSIGLLDQTRWKPQRAWLQIGQQPPLDVPLSKGRYRFEIPPQIRPAVLTLRIGDATQRTEIQPTRRPELVAAAARVMLPTYLGRPEPVDQDVRGGSLSLVKASRVALAVTADRPLASAQIAGQNYRPDVDSVTSDPLLIHESQTIQIAWRDTLGLAPREPFSLSVTTFDDLAPTLICDDLPDQEVVLDSQLLTFQVRVEDDFGVRRVGLQWQPLDEAASQSLPTDSLPTDSPAADSPAAGQRPLAAGGATVDRLQVTGSFCAKTLGIQPQPILLRVWAEDYLPGRPRVYSALHTLYVLGPDEHALWIADQLGKWHRQSLEVRDRELQLHETNKQLRDLPPAALHNPETRRQIQRQASEERANGSRLASLTRDGEQLLRQAARNPEMGADPLERWAQTLQVLKEISTQRMPSVADLLNQAAAEAITADQPQQAPRTVAGQIRAAGQAGPQSDDAGPDDAAPDRPPATPKLVDVESTHQPAARSDAGPPPPGDSGPPRLGLPGTTILGGADDGQGGAAADRPEVAPAADAALDDAVDQQQDLLAEFDKVAEQLDAILANLEGSTLVKRLKASSRRQYQIASRIAAQLEGTFAAVPGAASQDQQALLAQLSSEQSETTRDVSLIMDDMQAYFDRRRLVTVKEVLTGMRHADVLGGLRQLADDIPTQQGLSIAQCEYWSDALDRWAENLVESAASGQAPGAKSAGSLPPSIVLDVLRVLQSEVDLREATRVAQQARGAQAAEDYRRRAGQLASDQSEVHDRLGQVVADIARLPGGETEFADDLGLLKSVLPVMREASEILATPDTGSPAVAAETEAIELLLKSKRVNPGAGGGGGATAGGGGGGPSEADSALALLGAGIDADAVRQADDTAQSVGTSGPGLPEEFRAGLDEYFNRLESPLP